MVLQLIQLKIVYKNKKTMNKMINKIINNNKMNNNKIMNKTINVE